MITDAFEVSVPAPTVTVSDTIGAGDTAHGALLAYLDAHGALDPQSVRGFGENDWRDALTYAARAAAITVSRPGADPPTSADMG
ncbi:sugar/nucleoside kinase (ribokinase family) [Rhodococcus sp. 27YEA15]